MDKMNVDEHLHFIRKLKTYVDKENLVSMEVNLQHQSLIGLTNPLSQLQGDELEKYTLKAKKAILE
jgi:hypothetical protein